MQAAKRKVTYLQALWPCALILVVTLVILILWTALDPWKWEREFLSLVPPETLGKCTSESFAGFFWSLTVILMFCTLSTLVMAWRTQTIAQNLSDTSTVFYLILTQAQAWFVGIPILAVIGDESVDTVYFGRILLIWMFAMAPLFIVLLPRVSQAIRQQMYPELRQNGGNVHVSGINSSASASHKHATKRHFSGSNSNPSSNEELQPSRPFASSVMSAALKFRLSTTSKSEEGPSAPFQPRPVADGDDEVPSIMRRRGNINPLPTITSQHVLQSSCPSFHERSHDRESFPSFNSSGNESFPTFEEQTDLRHIESLASLPEALDETDRSKTDTSDRLPLERLPEAVDGTGHSKTETDTRDKASLASFAEALDETDHSKTGAPDKASLTSLPAILDDTGHGKMDARDNNQ